MRPIHSRDVTLRKRAAYAAALKIAAYPAHSAAAPSGIATRSTTSDSDTKHPICEEILSVAGISPTGTMPQL
jgi:hypothetical protein